MEPRENTFYVANGSGPDFVYIAAVAQGIRCSQGEKIYCVPSLEFRAAETFCISFVNSLLYRDQFNTQEISKAFAKGNLAIGELNRSCDYSACVGSAGVITGEKLIYGKVSDSGVCVYDSKGKLRFRTKDSKNGEARDNNDKCWINPKFYSREEGDFRNNLTALASLEALTGEKRSLQYIGKGIVDLKRDDFVFFYTSEMEEIVHGNYFEQHLKDKGLEGLEELCGKLSYGKEGTLVGNVVR